MIQKAKNRNLISNEKQNSEKNSRINITNKKDKNTIHTPIDNAKIEIKVPPKKTFDNNIKKIQFLCNHFIIFIKCNYTIIQLYNLYKN